MQEHQADVYGIEAIHGLVADPQQSAASAFQVLAEAGLEVPDENGLIVFWNYTHPPISQRLNFAASHDPWKAGEHPKYFPEDSGK